MSNQYFKYCEHGICVKSCVLCQFIAFENAVENRLIKDVRNYIFLILKEQPIEQIYCCKCEKGYKIMTPKEVEDNGYYSSEIFARNCDSHIHFKRTKVLILAHEFSKYGQDGYIITAGIFIASKDFLSEDQVKQIYNARDKLLVCDNCINEMLTNNQLGKGGGYNEHIF